MGWAQTASLLRASRRIPPSFFSRYLRSQIFFSVYFLVFPLSLGTRKSGSSELPESHSTPDGGTSLSPRSTATSPGQAEGPTPTGASTSTSPRSWISRARLPSLPRAARWAQRQQEQSQKQLPFAQEGPGDNRTDAPATNQAAAAPAAPGGTTAGAPTTVTRATNGSTAPSACKVVPHFHFFLLALNKYIQHTFFSVKFEIPLSSPTQLVDQNEALPRQQLLLLLSPHLVPRPMTCTSRPLRPTRCPTPTRSVSTTRWGSPEATRYPSGKRPPTPTPPCPANRPG